MPSVFASSFPGPGQEVRPVQALVGILDTGTAKLDIAAWASTIPSHQPGVPSSCWTPSSWPPTARLFGAVEGEAGEVASFAAPYVSVPAPAPPVSPLYWTCATPRPQAKPRRRQHWDAGAKLDWELYYRLRCLRLRYRSRPPALKVLHCPGGDACQEMFVNEADILNHLGVGPDSPYSTCNAFPHVALNKEKWLSRDADAHSPFEVFTPADVDVHPSAAASSSSETLPTEFSAFVDAHE